MRLGTIYHVSITTVTRQKTIGTMTKFRGKYRIESPRLKNWDYGWDGSYFVTICTKDRYCFFGHIQDGQFIANSMGEIAGKYWMEMPDHYSFVELDEFVVMPNHVHGILWINRKDAINQADAIDAMNRVSTTTGGGVTGKHNPMLQDNLSRVMRWYKGRVSFECRKINIDFGWQERFHDHIIRDEPSYQRIKEYIRNNPLNRETDKFYDNEKKDQINLNS